MRLLCGLVLGASRSVRRIGPSGEASRVLTNPVTRNRGVWSTLTAIRRAVSYA